MLPLNEYPIVWLVIFGAALIVLFGFSRLVQVTANELTDLEKKFSSRLNKALILWPLIAIGYSFLIGLDFTTFAPMLIIPLLLGLVLTFQPSIILILQHIPLHLLVLLGAYRVAGAVFVYTYYQHGILSYGFAFNAGWGDVLTGVLAPIVAYLVYKRIPGFFTIIVIWTLIGVCDLILAPVSAGIYGAERLVDFPLNLIPLFLGPPFGILLHVITLRAAWLQRIALSTRVSQSDPKFQVNQ